MFGKCLQGIIIILAFQRACDEQLKTQEEYNREAFVLRCWTPEWFSMHFYYWRLRVTHWRWKSSFSLQIKESFGLVVSKATQNACLIFLIQIRKIYSRQVLKVTSSHKTSPSRRITGEGGARPRGRTLCPGPSRWTT